MQFYGYKKCSTCRNAHKFLVAHGFDLPFQDFVETPPSIDTLREWIAKRSQGVMPFVNTKGTQYRERGLAHQQLSEDDWLKLLSEDGRLIKRPVLVTGDQVLVGFQQEEYERLLNS
ncbi:arsenate reductase family protein [Alicyclobacillus sp. ALC3]|uniref:arsenate reductase family protein n=1 Tax=Alicyclobacillus sp. ALC3 TaxID=2796143 RepID=UPI002378B990|nr:Spx/MgsR family RNA polymerase-binding regulatory protein [Alicyclobacillus sp. ALC3]WDL96079.1 Spx/MgsR family RNA polymerase-binding regulatory protein [Alicyclobacillus sp. ALC3]